MHARVVACDLRTRELKTRRVASASAARSRPAAASPHALHAVVHMFSSAREPSGNATGAARAAPVGDFVGLGSAQAYSPSGRTVSLNVTSMSFGSFSLMS